MDYNIDYKKFSQENNFSEIIKFLSYINLKFSVEHKNNNSFINLYKNNFILKINIELSGQINISEGPDMVPTENIFADIAYFINNN